jgi:hypothetical protein
MRKYLFLATVVMSFGFSLSSEAALTTDALDIIRASLTTVRNGEDVAIPALIKSESAKFRGSMVFEYKTDAADHLVGTSQFILLKKPRLKVGSYEPGLILRKGLFTRFNQKADTLWISILTTTERPGVGGYSENLNFLKKFASMYQRVVQENPTFSMKFFEKYDYATSKYHSPIQNINLTQTDTYMSNIEQRVTMNGHSMETINIPISKDDNIEDVLQLINSLDKDFVLN